MSGFDVEVQKIEHDPVGQIAKAPIVNDDSFAGIDHLICISKPSDQSPDKATLI